MFIFDTIDDLCIPSALDCAYLSLLMLQGAQVGYFFVLHLCVLIMKIWSSARLLVFSIYFISYRRMYIWALVAEPRASFTTSDHSDH